MLQSQVDEWRQRCDEAEQQRFLLQDDNQRLQTDLVSSPSRSHQVLLCSLYCTCVRVCVCVQEQLSAVIAEKGSFTPKLGSRPSTPLSSARPSIDGSFTMPGRSLADEFAAYVSVCCCHARAFVTFCHVCTFRMMTWWNNWNKKLLRSNNS